MSMKHPSVFAFLLLMALYCGGCGNDTPSQTSAEQAETKENPAPGQDAPASRDAGQPSDSNTDAGNSAEAPGGLTIEMRNAGLTKLVLGKWQNKTVPGKAIEFTEAKFRRFLNDKLVGEYDYEIDAECGPANCLVDGQKPFGWCFIVKEGKEPTCHVVSTCNAVDMVVALPAEGGAKQNYVRIGGK